MPPVTLASALSDLYAVAGILAAACYGPQLLRLWRSAQARRAMSLLTWGGWLAVGVVTLLYAVVVVRQPEMVLVNGLNIVCQCVVVGLAGGQRLADKGWFTAWAERRRSWRPRSGWPGKADVPRH